MLLVTTIGAVWGGVYLAREGLTAQNNHHAQSMSQNNEIIKILTEHTDTLKQIDALRTEVTQLAAKLGPALTAGQDALIAKLTWIECSLATPGTCGTPP